MKRAALFSALLIFSGSVFWGTNITIVSAQDLGVRVPIKNVIQNPASSARRTSRPQVKIQKVIVPVREIRRETRVVKTSNLTVASEAGAKILVEGLASGIKPLTKLIPRDKPEDKTVEFENLRPGKYKVSASLEGYKTQETEVDVLPQKTVGISLELDATKYQLKIDTNIKDGEIRYAPARLEKSDAKGVVTKETGGYCIVKIQNNKALIPDLKDGYYNIDIRPSAVEYQTQLTAINIPDDLPDDDTPYGINLEKKISTETFASAWTSNDWILPAGWKLSGKMETKSSVGIALPRNEQYRYYTNFEMISDVKSLDGKTIGFVLRAIDPQNYYLVQISGARAGEPHRVTGYIVKDGKGEQIFSNFIEHFSKTIAASKPFRVIIKGEENVFKIFIEDSETGDRRELGNIIDRDKNFRKGAIGISGANNSNFEVGFFTVCASSCR